MSGAELFLGGVAAFAVLSVLVRARAGVKRAQAATEIAQVAASPVSLVGRVLVSGLVIVTPPGRFDRRARSRGALA